jgi:hypothetical protein
MSARNRVTPLGEIASLEQRGMFIGNRGCLHVDRTIVRQWHSRRWIVCALDYKGWVAPKWVPGRWTALFFWDEAVALAAGHRPCALCRHNAYAAWCDAWAAATGSRQSADNMDRQLHTDRVTAARTKQTHQQPWAELPKGAFVTINGTAALVLDDRLVPWSAEPTGYSPAIDRPTRGIATVLTPRSTVEVIRQGYAPELHAAAEA